MGQKLLAADERNPRGYFEDVDFLDFQRRLLADHCLPDDNGHPDWGWTESEQLDQQGIKAYGEYARKLLITQTEGRGLWGWKDPRTTLLLDFWNALLDNAVYILVYRFPWDVADSLQRIGEPLFTRHPDYAYRIWRFYNQHLLDFYRKNSSKCLLVSVNALQQNPNQLATLIHNKFKLELSSVDLTGLYEKDLLARTDAEDPLIDLVAATYPQCTNLLEQLDDLADLSSYGLWRVNPLKFISGTSQDQLSSIPVKVSVIIPCFNDGRFLIDAIASVERFAPENCELILVNDGSNEKVTLEILETLAETGYRILNQENLGLSAARNAGIHQASGCYILPLDADNRLRAGFIESAIKELESSSTTGVVYGYRQFFGLKTGTDEVGEFNLEEMLKFNYIDACAVFRRQVWDDCKGYDQNMSPLEDWDLWIGAAEKGWRFHRLTLVTFDYRIRPESLLSMVDDAALVERLFAAMIEKHYELYQPRLIKQLAEMKRNSAHLTASVRRLSDENDRLRGELLTTSTTHGQSPQPVEHGGYAGNPIAQDRHTMKQGQTIAPPLLDDLVNETISGSRDVRVGDRFLLKGIIPKWAADSLRLICLWESLLDQRLNAIQAIHFVADDGKLLGGADHPQDENNRFIRQGQVWVDIATMSNTQLSHAKYLGFGIYMLGGELMPIENGVRDWNNRRLLVDILAETAPPDSFPQERTSNPHSSNTTSTS